MALPVRHRELSDALKSVVRHRPRREVRVVIRRRPSRGTAGDMVVIEERFGGDDDDRSPCGTSSRYGEVA